MRWSGFARAVLAVGLAFVAVVNLMEFDGGDGWVVVPISAAQLLVAWLLLSRRHTTLGVVLCAAGFVGGATATSWYLMAEGGVRSCRCLGLVETSIYAALVMQGVVLALCGVVIMGLARKKPAM